MASNFFTWGLVGTYMLNAFILAVDSEPRKAILSVLFAFTTAVIFLR